jgi:hemolysin D
MNTAASTHPSHPAWALLLRYGLADEAAFLPAALSLRDTPVHPAPRRLAWTIMALACAALTWAMVGELEVVAVAHGRIVVSERTKVVQPLERSLVKRVLVRDGERVRAGQPLVELDPTVAAADQATVAEQLRASTGDTLRARALLQALARDAAGAAPVVSWPSGWSDSERSAAQSQLDAAWDDIAARRARLSAEVARRQAEIATAREVVAKLEATVPLVRQREQDFQALAQQGFVASHAGQDRMRERIEQERELATQLARLAEAQAGLTESEQAQAAYLAETRRVLSEREAEARLRREAAAQETAKSAQRQKLTTLTAPVDGVVQQLAVHTSGGVVTEAQALMVIVPESAETTVEVVLENKDVGFVHPGQAAAIKLETFPFTRYGTVDATVLRVSADAVQDEKRGAVFPVSLALRPKHIEVDGKFVRLSAGMNVTAEIKTGNRRIIDYLLSPVQRSRHESMRER